MFKTIRFLRLPVQAYLPKTELEQLLLLSVIFSLSLNVVRSIYTGQLLFFFLLWNLFLAAIPYGISRSFLRSPHWIEKSPRFWAAAICWLLFLPNSFYIITDLFHLHERPEVPLWFDLALIFSYAWNGLLLGIVSLRQMEKIMAAKFGWQSEVFFILPIMFLNALGIFIGRYLRYNSWDIITNPFALIQDIGYLIIHPVRNRFDWSMIVCFTVLLLFIYTTLKRISKAVW